LYSIARLVNVTAITTILLAISFVVMVIPDIIGTAARLTAIPLLYFYAMRTCI
jgi:hypothetical protein